MKTIVVEVLIEKDDKILMVQESKKEKLGKWNMPAGKLEDNEDIITACKREVKEETNLDIDIKGLICIEENVSSIGNLIVLYLKANYVSGEIKYNKDEIKDVKWMSKKEINNLGLDNIRGGKTINKVLDYSNDLININRIMIENNFHN